MHLYLAIPKPPGTPKVVNVTRDCATIAWEEPISDGGSPVTGYYIEKKEKNSILWQKETDKSISSLSYVVRGDLHIKVFDNLPNFYIFSLCRIIGRVGISIPRASRK